MVKNLELNETMKFEDAASINLRDTQGILETKVTAEIRKKDGSVLFADLGSNASLVGGVQEYVRNMWNIDPAQVIKIKNLESDFPTVSGTPTFLSDKRQIFAFGIGIDGEIGGTTLAVARHKKGYDKDKLIALHTINTGIEDVNFASTKYAFRTVDGSDAMWFLKKIQPEYRMVSANTKKVVSNDPDTTYTSSENVICHCRLKIKLEKGEVDRWFGKKFGTTDDTYCNSLILFSGKPCTTVINGVTVNTFRDVLATNKINFKTIGLQDTEVAITYDIYFA